MSKFILCNYEKQLIHTFLSALQSATEAARETFLFNAAAGNSTIWLRYLPPYSQYPISWWLGILQLQKQMGLWGPEHKQRADLRAQMLKDVCQPLLFLPRQHTHSDKLLAQVRYNLHYHELDLQRGLLAKQLSQFKLSQQLINIAAYGDATNAIATRGAASYQGVLQKLITGKLEQTPVWLPPLNSTTKHGFERNYCDLLQQGVNTIIELSDTRLEPNALQQFCMLPEQLPFKG